ncbi:hypothetical protein AgCh_001248 [Apium graveolens]
MEGKDALHLEATDPDYLVVINDGPYKPTKLVPATPTVAEHLQLKTKSEWSPEEKVIVLKDAKHHDYLVLKRKSAHFRLVLGTSSRLRWPETTATATPDSWSDQIRGHNRPICALDPVYRAKLGALLGTAAMADSFISISSDYSEPFVGGPSSDPRPALPPVSAIILVTTDAPMRTILPPSVRLPI